MSQHQHQVINSKLDARWEDTRASKHRITSTLEKESSAPVAACSIHDTENHVGLRQYELSLYVSLFF